MFIQFSVLSIRQSNCSRRSGWWRHQTRFSCCYTLLLLSFLLIVLHALSFVTFFRSHHIFLYLAYDFSFFYDTSKVTTNTFMFEQFTEFTNIEVTTRSGEWTRLFLRAKDFGSHVIGHAWLYVYIYIHIHIHYLLWVIALDPTTVISFLSVFFVNVDILTMKYLTFFRDIRSLVDDFNNYGSWRMPDIAFIIKVVFRR